MIDLEPTKYLLADAQRRGWQTVEVPYGMLQALIHKVHRIQQIEEHIPKQIGYCSADEIRAMCTGRGKLSRVKRAPWSVFTVPIYFMGDLPKNEIPVAVVADT